LLQSEADFGTLADELEYVEKALASFLN